MAVTNDQILQWFQENQGASDADIFAAMGKYGVSPEQLSAATGHDLADVQQRYEDQWAAAGTGPQPLPSAPATQIPTIDTSGVTTRTPDAFNHVMDALRAYQLAVGGYRLANAAFGATGVPWIMQAGAAAGEGGGLLGGLGGLLSNPITALGGLGLFLGAHLTKDSTPSMNAGFLLHKDSDVLAALPTVEGEPFASGVVPYVWTRNAAMGKDTDPVLDVFRSVDSAVTGLIRERDPEFSVGRYDIMGYNEEGLKAGEGVFYGAAGQKGKPGETLDEQAKFYAGQLLEKAARDGIISEEEKNDILSAGSINEVLNKAQETLSSSVGGENEPDLLEADKDLIDGTHPGTEAPFDYSIYAEGDMVTPNAKPQPAKEEAGLVVWTHTNPDGSVVVGDATGEIWQKTPPTEQPMQWNTVINDWLDRFPSATLDDMREAVKNANVPTQDVVDVMTARGYSGDDIGYVTGQGVGTVGTPGTGPYNPPGAWTVNPLPGGTGGTGGTPSGPGNGGPGGGGGGSNGGSNGSSRPDVEGMLAPTKTSELMFPELYRATPMNLEVLGNLLTYRKGLLNDLFGSGQ